MVACPDRSKTQISQRGCLVLCGPEGGAGPGDVVNADHDAVVVPYLGPVDYRAAQVLPTFSRPEPPCQARQFARYEAVYAIEAGNYALNLNHGNPAIDADWAAARDAYQTAARLGSYSPGMFRELAIVDEYLRDDDGAVAAARRALQLDCYDPASQQLVKRLTGQ